MKKVFFIILFGMILFFAGCSKDRISNQASPEMWNREGSAATRGYSEEENHPDYSVSQEMVESFIHYTSKTNKTHYSITTYPSEENPVLYVVNFEEGWKIIPGDSRFGLVLAESATGHVNVSEITDNPGFRLWIEDYQNQIESARGRIIGGSKANGSARIWDSFRAPQAKDSMVLGKNLRDRGMMWGKINFQSNTVIDTTGYKAPLLQTKWGQGNPWYISMPERDGYKCLTGCAAVAVSQILYFFHSQQSMPSGLYGTVSLSGTTTHYEGPIPYYTISVSRSNFTYNSSLWNNMPLDSTVPNPTGFKNVSDLMLDVGARLNLHYSPYNTYVEKDTLGFFNTMPCKVSGTWAPYSMAALAPVVSSLDSNKPVIAAAIHSSNGSGHTWVIDGYLLEEVTTTNTYEWWPVNMIPAGTVVYEYKDVNELLVQYNYMIYQGMPEVTETSDFYRLYHMNWGADGQGDGYASVGSPYNHWQGYTNNIVVQLNLVADEFTVN